MDDAIRDEEYILKLYDYLILGKGSAFLLTGNKLCGCHSQKYKRESDRIGGLNNGIV